MSGAQLANYIKPIPGTESLYRITTRWLGELGDKDDSSQRVTSLVSGVSHNPERKLRNDLNDSEK